MKLSKLMGIYDLDMRIMVNRKGEYSVSIPNIESKEMQSSCILHGEHAASSSIFQAIQNYADSISEKHLVIRATDKYKRMECMFDSISLD